MIIEWEISLLVVSTTSIRMLLLSVTILPSVTGGPCSEITLYLIIVSQSNKSSFWEADMFMIYYQRNK